MVQSSLQKIPQNLLVIELFLVHFWQICQYLAYDLQPGLNQTRILLIDWNKLYVQFFFTDLETLLYSDVRICRWVLEQGNQCL